MPKLCVLCFRVGHAPPGGRAREVTTLAVGDLVVSAKYSERVGMIGCSRWRGTPLAHADGRGRGERGRLKDGRGCEGIADARLVEGV